MSGQTDLPAYQNPSRSVLWFSIMKSISAASLCKEYPIANLYSFYSCCVTTVCSDTNKALLLKHAIAIRKTPAWIKTSVKEDQAMGTIPRVKTWNETDYSYQSYCILTHSIDRQTCRANTILHLGLSGKQCDCQHLHEPGSRRLFASKFQK